MAKGLPLLNSITPKLSVPADIRIGHVQLRDLIICPHKQGTVTHVHHQSIVERNLQNPDVPPRSLVDLSFTPNTLAALPIPETEFSLLAVGGQEAELHIALYAPAGRPCRSWSLTERLHASINNSVLLTTLNLAKAHYSSSEPRLVVSNNDCTVKVFDVPLRTSRPSRLEEVGLVRLNVPVNHSSISPDGRTLLSVGDSSKVFLHRLDGSSRINFHSIATLSMPGPDFSVSPTSTLAASFSTSFSSDGTKYAVASQEGTVAVWDVRSSKPLKVFHTDKTRAPMGAPGNGSASGWLSEDPYEWTRGNSRGPGWSVRNVKFGNGGSVGSGKEIMTFTEHTSFLHVVDARTFETEQVVRVPSTPAPRSRTVTRGPRRRTHVYHQRTEPPHNPVVPRTAAFRTLHPPPPPPYLVMALEDTFRISSSHLANSSSLSSSWTGHDISSSAIEEEDLVVIPPLGDRQVEEDVQTLLGHHARHGQDYAYDYGERISGDDMEVDELESDCLSSHTPSRASSPTPSAQATVGSRSPARLVAPPEERIEEEEEASDSEIDIAGTCFDPSGAFIYVATTGGISEWQVRGAEKRWWHDDDWQ